MVNGQCSIRLFHLELKQTFKAWSLLLLFHLLHQHRQSFFGISYGNQNRLRVIWDWCACISPTLLTEITSGLLFMLSKAILLNSQHDSSVSASYVIKRHSIGHLDTQHSQATSSHITLHRRVCGRLWHFLKSQGSRWIRSLNNFALGCLTAIKKDPDFLSVGDALLFADTQCCPF